MVNKKLSYIFRYRYLKLLLISTSVLINFTLMLFAIFYLIWGGEKTLEVLIFSLIYTTSKSIFDYYLIRSKDVFFDEKYTYVKTINNQLISIQNTNIKTIKRVYYFFYKISLKEKLDLPIKSVYYFISPNPSFFRQKELKEIINYAKNC